MNIYFKKINKAEIRGFTLVETLVAVSIFTVSILGLLAILSKGVSDTAYAKKKIIASYLAQEGIEQVRNMRDTYVLFALVNGKSWAAFKAEMAECVLGSECALNSSVGVTDPNYTYPCALQGCRLYVENGNYNSQGLGSESGFIRKIWIEEVNADDVEIHSQVSWSQNSGNYEISFSEKLYYWME